MLTSHNLTRPVVRRMIDGDARGCMPVPSSLSCIDLMYAAMNLTATPLSRLHSTTLSSVLSSSRYHCSGNRFLHADQPIVCRIPHFQAAHSSAVCSRPRLQMCRAILWRTLCMRQCLWRYTVSRSTPVGCPVSPGTQDAICSSESDPCLFPSQMTIN